MESTPGSAFCLVLLLLAVLPDCARGTPCAWGRGDSHSLHYDFNISSHKQPWCMVQGQMDGEKYLLYDCGSSKVISMNLQREEVKAMDSCEVMLSTLTDMGNELKPLLPDIKQEKDADGAPLPLQVRMTCLCKADGSTSGSLEFSLGGQRFVAFDSETEEYRADNSVGERLKKKWENDEDLNKFFKMTLKGDCKKLYQCSLHWKKELERTAAPITVPAPATTTPNIASASPAKTTDQFKTWTIIPFVSVIVTVLIILCIIGYHYRKRSQKMLTCCWECGLVQKVSQLFGCLSISSCSPVDLQELPSLQQMQRLAEGREDTADAMLMSCSP
ncbi:UL16-binding protein 3 isoform X4 [Myotis daubentonii]|uniref:UL16-binding protein 3 isoform X4 n=1 Tax=Myotis daubentonii TaxID=98922 RepID=UPI0028732325|nr:UL16-binding protein 3 isoform X4 [Myotis daubentonii]